MTSPAAEMPRERKRIYIAGPMSKGNLLAHVRHAVHAADVIILAGGAPYLPQLSVLHELILPHDYETWMTLDFEWIRVCHAVYRIHGESSGADREVAFAQALGIPVLFSIAEVLAWLASTRTEETA